MNLISLLAVCAVCAAVFWWARARFSLSAVNEKCRVKNARLYIRCAVRRLCTSWSLQRMCVPAVIELLFLHTTARCIRLPVQALNLLYIFFFPHSTSDNVRHSAAAKNLLLPLDVLHSAFRLYTYILSDLVGICWTVGRRLKEHKYDEKEIIDFWH